MSRAALQLAPAPRPAPGVSKRFALYMCGVAGVAFEERHLGWYWMQCPRIKVWQGPFSSKGDAAIGCLDFFAAD